MNDERASSLEELVGETLSSVIFVAGHVQLDFNGPRLSAYAWPLVTVGEEARVFGDPGYRDALCVFIMHTVVTTEESPEAGLVIRFKLGAIVINPQPADLSGAEIAVFTGSPNRHQLTVWRPGEGTFSGRDWS
jgi:hypothetical protein